MTAYMPSIFFGIHLYTAQSCSYEKYQLVKAYCMTAVK